MPALHISKPQKRKVQGEVSDYWYVRVTKSDGKRTWRTTATTDYKEAQEYRKKLFDDLAKEEKRLARRSLGTCLDEWLASKEPRVVESTYRTIEHKVKQIRKHFGEETSVTKIDVGWIETFLCAYAAEKTQWVKEGRNASCPSIRTTEKSIAGLNFDSWHTVIVRSSRHVARRHSRADPAPTTLICVVARM